MRPNLDGADFGFGHRIGQAAKTGATNLDNGYAQKAYDAMPQLTSCDHVGSAGRIRLSHGCEKWSEP